MQGQRRNIVTAALLLALAVVAYARAASFGFVGLDDWELVSENPYVMGGLDWEGVRWAFTISSSLNVSSDRNFIR